MPRVLVTGGAGFIGSHLVHAMVREGHQVVVIDDLSSGRLENLAGVRDNIEFHVADVRARDSMVAVMRGIDYILHLAAIASVPRSVADPAATHDVNVNGTMSILLAAREAGVRRIIFASSSAAYGDGPHLPKKESMVPSPLSPYAASKLAGEMYMRSFAQEFELDTVSLRYFNVYGPRQDPASEYAAVIPKFISIYAADSSPVIFGDGRQTRDFIHVDDMVRANLMALKAQRLNGSAINIASGRRTSLLDLSAMIAVIFGRAPDAVHAVMRSADIRHSVADITLAGRLLGFKPSVTLEAGLKQTIAWYLSALSTAQAAAATGEI